MSSSTTPAQSTKPKKATPATFSMFIPKPAVHSPTSISFSESDSKSRSAQRANLPNVYKTASDKQQALTFIEALDRMDDLFDEQPSWRKVNGSKILPDADAAMLLNPSKAKKKAKATASLYDNVKMAGVDDPVMRSQAYGDAIRKGMGK